MRPELMIKFVKNDSYEVFFDGRSQGLYNVFQLLDQLRELWPIEEIEMGLIDLAQTGNTHAIYGPHNGLFIYSK